MDQLLTTLQNISPDVWLAILGAGGVSIVTQIIKKALKLENEKVVQFLFATVAFAASGMDYLLTSHNLPPTILGVQTVTLMGIATPVYFYVIKPLSDFVIAVKQVLNSQPMKTMASYQAPAAAPSQTPTATWQQQVANNPITPPEQNQNDFKF